MESNATSLGGFGSRGRTQNGSNRNDADNCLSHINLFSPHFGAAAILIAPVGSFNATTTRFRRCR